MSDFYAQVVTIFLGFFAIMNPIANTAVFAALTGESNKAERSRIAVKSLLITFCVITAFALLGKSIFHLFGITLPALRITGGVLVFLVGYHMLNGTGSHLHSGGHDESSDVAVSPLAVPILAGPGTIATAMNFSATGGLTGISTTIAVFAVLCVLTYVCFASSTRILKMLGPSALSIVTRLMGLILAVIGTQMLIEGTLGALAFESNT
ncbi:MAG: MarC family protein [Pseudomonadota bacterium]